MFSFREPVDQAIIMFFTTTTISKLTNFNHFRLCCVICTYVVQDLYQFLRPLTTHIMLRSGLKSIWSLEILEMIGEFRQLLLSLGRNFHGSAHPRNFRILRKFEKFRGIDFSVIIENFFHKKNLILCQYSSNSVHKSAYLNGTNFRGY